MKFLGFVLVSGMILMQQPVLGHHSVLAFDGKLPTVLHGTVLSVQWQNPHVYLEIKVPDAGGGATAWTVEAESPHMLERLGWTRSSVVPGQVISVLGAPDRNGKPVLRCRTVTFHDSLVLPCFPLSED